MSTEATARQREDGTATLAGVRNPAGKTDRHGPVAQLLIAWSPLSAILVAYWVVQWISAPLGTGDDASVNRVGAGLHVLGPARADEQVFGTVPAVWFQERLVDGATHWYDAAAALVYVTHFVSIPLVTAFVWFCLRDRFRAWLAAVLTFSLVGILGYVVYPAAPPWLAAERGAIGDIDRIAHLGWEHLGLDPIARLTQLAQQGSNPVAAMPSLHAGAALLIALALWPSIGSLGRTVLLAYAVLMALTLVYTGEHYVVDVVAGWLVAVVAVVAAAAIRRRGRDTATGGPGSRGCRPGSRTLEVPT